MPLRQGPLGLQACRPTIQSLLDQGCLRPVLDWWQKQVPSMKVVAFRAPTTGVAQRAVMPRQRFVQVVSAVQRRPANLQSEFLQSPATVLKGLCASFSRESGRTGRRAAGPSLSWRPSGRPLLRTPTEWPPPAAHPQR